MERRASQASVFHLPTLFFFSNRILIYSSYLQFRGTNRFWKMDEVYLEKLVAHVPEDRSVKAQFSRKERRIITAH